MCMYARRGRLRARAKSRTVKYKTIPSSTGLYFVTSRITDHRRIFFTDELGLIPLKSLEWMRENDIWRLYAFCLMPNHLHILVELLVARAIEKIMGQFHSFTGHRIVERLKQSERAPWLNYFGEAGEQKGDREFLIWQDALARNVEQENVLLDVIEYVHNNPVSKGWSLADDRADYRYSSAGYYDRGLMPIIPVDDYRVLLLG
jgi:putative transposase